MLGPNATVVELTRTLGSTDSSIALTGIAAPGVEAGAVTTAVAFPGVAPRGDVHHIVKERDQSFKTRVRLTPPRAATCTGTASTRRAPGRRAASP